MRSLNVVELYAVFGGDDGGDCGGDCGSSNAGQDSGEPATQSVTVTGQAPSPSISFADGAVGALVGAVGRASAVEIIAGVAGGLGVAVSIPVSLTIVALATLAGLGVAYGLSFTHRGATQNLP